MPAAGDGPTRLSGHATLFGFDDAPVSADITPRSRAWRVGGAARTFGGFVVIAPFVAIFPPHAVWPIGALATGGFLARRRYIERFTLQSLEGECPKCGKAITVKPTRLRIPHPLPCDGCHHESSLRFADGVLESIAVD